MYWQQGGVRLENIHERVVVGMNENGDIEVYGMNIKGGIWKTEIFPRTIKGAKTFTVLTEVQGG